MAKRGVEDSGKSRDVSKEAEQDLELDDFGDTTTGADQTSATPTKRRDSHPNLTDKMIREHAPNLDADVGLDERYGAVDEDIDQSSQRSPNFGSDPGGD